MIKNISRIIHRKCKKIVYDKDTIQVYKQVGIGYVKALFFLSLKISQTSLVHMLSNYRKYILSLIIGNIITNAVTYHPILLEIGFGVILRKESLVEQFQGLSIFCS